MIAWCIAGFVAGVVAMICGLLALAMALMDRHDRRQRVHDVWKL